METTNGHLGPKSGAKDDDKGWLMLEASSGGLTSSEGLRIYKRRKRIKMSNSDEIINTNFYDKIKAADNNRSAQMSSFDAFPNGPGECSFRHCDKTVLQQQTHQSQNGHDDGLVECIQNTVATYPEISGFTSVVKESIDNVERSDNQTHNSAEEVSHKQSECCTNSELCGRAFTDILNSDKFSELCSLLCKSFGAVNVNLALDIDGINSKMKNGAYETSPMLYVKDIQQVWTKIQQVSDEMASLAKSLSDKSRAHYEQFIKKPSATNGCQGCGKKADVRNCLVCDTCEDMYHLSCTEVIGTEIPPKSWYCTRCVSNGIGSPHDNCVVCEKLKSTASISYVNVVPSIDQSQNGLVPDVTTEEIGPRICFICKTDVKNGDESRTCGHLLCAHKFYHNKCLTNKQLGVCGPCWYCPSCLCRRCLIDKDDDQIVLCDGCDQAYHIYCTSPQLDSIPEGSWFCGKCEKQVKRISIMKRVYENMQKKVKVEEDDVVGAVNDEREGLDMLVTAAKTLSHQDTNDTFRDIV